MDVKNDEWKKAWAPLLALIGTDIGDDEAVWGPDVVEAGAVRRYLEPLEFDCALHTDKATAQAHGYTDIIAPCTGLTSFTIPALWSPGEPIFTNPQRNAQPKVKALRPRVPTETPPFTGYFATDMEMDYLRAVTVGERLGRRGQRLVACTIKETKVGRGAFMTFETDLLTDQHEVVARMRSTLYCYNPHAAEEARP